MRLTARQRAFVDHFLVCRCGAEAARRAGFAKKSAHVTASRLLIKDNVRAALRDKEAELKRVTEISKQRVVNELLDGIGVAKERLNAGQMIRGWLAIARVLGLDKPEERRLELGAEDEALKAKLEAMSDEELVAIIEKG